MSWIMDKSYIEKHLLSYTISQLKQGYELKDIKNALKRYGYGTDIINNVAKQAKRYELKNTIKSTQAIKREINEELYSYLLQLLVEYIKKELEKGYELYVIKKALINYGHKKAIVNKAIKAVKSGEQKIIRKKEKGVDPAILYSASAIITLIAIAFLATAASASISIVFQSLSPVLIAITIAYIIVSKLNSKKGIFYVPIAGVTANIIALILAMVYLRLGDFVGEPSVIAIINIALSLVLCIGIAAFSRLSPKIIKLPDDVGGKVIEVKEKIVSDSKPKIDSRIEEIRPLRHIDEIKQEKATTGQKKAPDKEHRL